MIKFPWIAIAAMALVIVISNILVKFPINNWLTWGALSYPFAFLVTDVTNRRYGAGTARRVVYFGFAVGVLASLYFADTRIALASGSAFLFAQLVDVSLFDWLRDRIWWVAPLISSVVSTILDTYMFFALAFSGSGDPWVQWAMGDLGVKLAMALVSLIPYAAFVRQKKSLIQ